MAIETARLRLRPPRLEDAGAFAAINADAEVTAFVSLSGPLARGESDLLLRKMLDHWADHGFGWWMAESRSTGELLGFVGLSHPTSLPPMADEVEVGWRLARAHWGQGYATEGAREAVHVAFEERCVPRLISIIDRDNARSLRVAAKLGMHHWRDMDHPRWPRGVQVHRLDRRR